MAGRERKKARVGAAVVAFVAAIVAAVSMLGLPLPAGAADGPAGAAASGGTKAARDLIAHVPADLRDRCAIEDPTQLPLSIAAFSGETNHVVAAVGCRPTSGADAFVAIRLDGRAAMQRTYRRLIGDTDTYVLEDRTADCEATGVDTTDGYGNTGNEACYYSSADDGTRTATIAWTTRPLQTVAFVLRDDGNATALRTFWEHHGLDIEAGRKNLPPLPDPKATLASGKRFIADHVPAAFADLCTARSMRTRSDDAAKIWEYRLSVKAQVVCTPRGDVDGVVYTQFRNAAIPESIVDRSVDLVAAGTACDAKTTTYTVSDRDAGIVKCGTQAADDGTTTLAIVAWTYRRLDVLGIAQFTGGDADALHAWWVDDSGPTD